MATPKQKRRAVWVKPKFKVGQRVTYLGNRRLRHLVTGRYWDQNYPGWRYRLNVKGLPSDLAACWAVIESELLPVRR
jgi:hypothetical protein